LLRSGEDEAARRRSFVDLELQVAEEIGRALHLIDDRPVGQRGQKAARIRHRELAHVERLETDVGQGGKGRAAEGGLARLPRAGDAHDRVIAREFGEAEGGISGDHRSRPSNRQRNVSCIANSLTYS